MTYTPLSNTVASWLVSSLRLLTVAMETKQCVIVVPLTEGKFLRNINLYDNEK